MQNRVVNARGKVSCSFSFCHKALFVFFMLLSFSSFYDERKRCMCVCVSVFVIIK
jgi:hypothetical protein